MVVSVSNSAFAPASSRPRPSARSVRSCACLGAVTEGNWTLGLQIAGGTGPILGLGMPVDRDIGNIGQDLCGPITALAEFEQIRRLVDKAGGVFVVQERRDA